MSRKKIRKSPTLYDSQPPLLSSDGPTPTSTNSTFTPVLSTDEKVDNYLESAKLYFRAHQLMMEPEDNFDGPFNQTDDLRKAVQTLDTAAVEETNTLYSQDTLLKAIGILGHAPCKTSLKTLSSFALTQNPLAPVATMALEECAVLYAGPAFASPL